MTEQFTYKIPSFDFTRDRHSRIPTVSKMVTAGDRTVYERLDPFSEKAFDYRDAIEIENHISGVEVIKRLIPKDGKMLYLASSYGVAPVMLKEEGYKVVSLDRDYRALHFARNYTNDQIRADAGSLPFISEGFSAVVSRDFLAKDYHLLSRDERKTIIEEIYRVLKRGGKAIFYTLYTAETEMKDKKPIIQGLPEVEELLVKFGSLERVDITYEDKAEKSTIVYIANK